MTKYKTKWDLGLLYESINDPQIEKDVLFTEKNCAIFEKKYRKKTTYQTNEKALKTALMENEKLLSNPRISKPLYYLYRMKSLDSNDGDVTAKIRLIAERMTKAHNKILFFPLALGAIKAPMKRKFLKSGVLVEYRYFLKTLFDSSKYYLKEDEERILSLKSSTSYSMWISGVDKALNKRKVKVKGKYMPLSEATNKVSELPTKERRRLGRDINAEYIAVSDFAESEINAIFTSKKVSDELRGYKEVYSSSILGNENKEKVVANLVDTVNSAKAVSHRFYRVKAKMLGLKSLEYADRSAKVGEVKRKFSFDDSVKILRSAFGKAGDQYVKILDTFLENGQIDVFPKSGKQGGAYQASVSGLPSYVLLNHVNSFRSLQTFAHEMGHAIHSELSDKQPAIYQDYSLSVAETASTFFENLAFEEVFETLSVEEKMVALHDDIGDSISTIFRQIALYNFEVEMHQKVRKEGFVPKEEIAKCMNRHMEAYLGSAFTMKEDDGYAFVGWSHIRYYFYVYTYAYGELISNALYEKYKEDASYMSKIEEFLGAGGSKAPSDIFKDIGVNIEKSDFWKLGIKKIEKDVRRLERLVNKKK